MNNETEKIFLLNAANQPSTTEQKIGEVLTQDVEDFSTVCRTCATVTEFVIPIFEGEGLQNNLAEKIHKHLPIKVSVEDDLPLVVCYQCASTLLAWHELVQCCAQADAALRTRRALAAAAAAAGAREDAKEESKPNSKETVQNSEQEHKFEEMPKFVVQAPDPPRYEEATPRRKTCVYCRTELPEHSYKEHLLSLHSDFLFHCDECDTYVDRKEFILHMSLHAVEYAAVHVNRPDPVKKERKTGRRRIEYSESESDKSSRSEKKPLKRQNRTDKYPVKRENAKKEQENEFSDHSDAEYGFAPLPESVFEAIEDTQDSQPVIDNEENSSQMPEKEENSSQIPEKEENSSQIPKKEEYQKENTVDSKNILCPDKTTTLPPKPEKNVIMRKTRTCPTCGKVYTASSSYFYHVKHHHNKSKDHACDVCGKKFGTKTCLVQHKLIHTDKYQYACKVCGKKFRANASLYIHEQTHNGVKNWGCSQCSLSFRWRTHLLRHVKRHSGDKGHVCVECGRGFSIKCDLLRHMKTHTAGDYSCEKCGLKFAQRRYLKVHVDKKHSAQPIKVPRTT